MHFSFNIHKQSEETISLKPGMYHIYLSGGYSVSLGSGFKLFIVNSDSMEEIPLKKTMKICSSFKGKRAVRLYEIEIPVIGNYNIRIEGRHDIEVRKSMLNLLKLIQKKPNDSEINLMITNESYN